MESSDKNSQEGYEVPIRLPILTTAFGAIPAESPDAAKRRSEESIRIFREVCDTSPDAQVVNSRESHLEKAFEELSEAATARSSEESGQNPVTSRLIDRVVELLNLTYEKVIPIDTEYYLEWSSIPKAAPSNYKKGAYIGIAGLADLDRNHVSDMESYMLGKIWGSARSVAKSQILKRVCDGIESVMSTACHALENAEKRAESIDAQMRSVEDRLERSSSQYSTLTGKVDSFQEKIHLAEREVDKAKKRIDDAVEGIVQQHREELAFSAPIAYWKARAKEYKRRKRTSSVVFYCGAGLAFVFIVVLLFLVLSPIILGNVVGYVSPLSIWEHLAVLSVPTALIVWVTRVLLRHKLSDAHLYEDASHKEVVLESYLSMLSLKDRPVTDEERSIAMKCLFMPLDDGLVRQEPSPTLWFLERPNA